MHDLVIANAHIIDGEGTPAIEGDLAVTDGRIAAIGRDLGPSRQRVDAEGRVLAPGIIDLHTHFDAQLTWDPRATPSNRLGVTTVVIGNCGFTIAPCKPEDRDRTLRNLTHVEGMSLDALRSGVDWDFESYPDYLDMLERKGMVPNVASFCGHSSVRTWVLGDAASKRAATPAEVAEMKRLVVEAMQAGAVDSADTVVVRGITGGGGGEARALELDAVLRYLRSQRTPLWRPAAGPERRVPQHVSGCV